MKMRTANGFKKTEEYKRIRKHLVNLFGQPDYTDHIVDGVSFKWYVVNLPREIKSEKNIKKYVESVISTPKNIFSEVKLIKNTRSLDNNPRKYHYLFYSDSLRILVRLKAYENQI